MEPKFEVKKYKSFRGREGYGFNLDLWQNGKLLAHVIDSGNGGMTHFEYIDREEGKKFQEYCKALPPLPPSEGFGQELPMSEDLFVGRLVDEAELIKKVKRDCSKKTCFKIPTDPKANYRMMAIPFLPDGKTAVLKKYPNAIILNETPQSEWKKIVDSGPVS